MLIHRQEWLHDNNWAEYTSIDPDQPKQPLQYKSPAYEMHLSNWLQTLQGYSPVRMHCQISNLSKILTLIGLWYDFPLREEWEPAKNNKETDKQTTKTRARKAYVEKRRILLLAHLQYLINLEECKINEFLH